MARKYKGKFVPEHPRADASGVVYEHVLVAEQKLCRYLKPEEAVHHIDENKRKNFVSYSFLIIPIE